MTTQNIEELRKLAEAAAPAPWTHGNHGEGKTCVWLDGRIQPEGELDHERHWIDCNTPSTAAYIAAANPAKVIELLDELQSQAERIKSMQQNMENIYAENKSLRAQLAALQSDDELPESPYVVDALRRVWTRVGFANPNDGENLFTADQLRQAQAKVRAKMVPLEKDADMFWNDDDAERNHNSIDEFLNEEICNGMGVEVGGEFTLRCAMSLPKIKIRVTSIDEEACEAEYEIIPDGITGEPK